MENELCRALDKIRAEDDLKDRTARYLHREIDRRSRAGKRARFRLAAVCAVLLLLLLAGGVSYGLYLTPSAYIDVDVNPSIGLTLNRFDRVICTQAYNDDGAVVLRDVNLRFKTYEEAMRILLDTMISKGYLAEDGLLSVSVQAKGGSAENDMIGQLNQIAAASLSAHHANTNTEVIAVTEDVRNAALGHHMTPAKYLAIAELQAVDPAATFEGCADHSISEIREQTRAHDQPSATAVEQRSTMTNNPSMMETSPPRRTDKVKVETATEEGNIIMAVMAVIIDSGYRIWRLTSASSRDILHYNHTIDRWGIGP